MICADKWWRLHGCCSSFCWWWMWIEAVCLLVFFKDLTSNFGTSSLLVFFFLSCAFWVLLVLMLLTFLCSHGMVILCAPSTRSWLRFGFVACSLSVAWCSTSPVQMCIYSLFLYPLDLAVHSQCQERTAMFNCRYRCEPFFRLTAGKQRKMGSVCRHDLYPAKGWLERQSASASVLYFAPSFAGKA